MDEPNTTSRRKTNHWLLFGALIGAVLFVAANGWMALRSVRWLETSQSWVDHTWEVIAQVEQIMSSAKDAETGSRGYVLTGDPGYLEPYQAAVQDLPRELNQFRLLTTDNGHQQQRVSDLTLLLQKRLELLGEADQMRAHSNAADAARSFVTLGTGKQTMDQMRSIANAMENEERQLLAVRMKDTQTAGHRVRYTILGASALDLLLIVFTFRHFVRERDLRLTSELTSRRLAQSRLELERNSAEILALNETLEARVQQRTAELEATNKELEAFSYSVSHDLRAPLRTIDGFSLALEEDYGEIVGESGKDYIRRVRAGVQRMGGLIDALLQLSRITRAEIEREPVDISALAEGVSSQILEQNPQQVIHFQIDKDMHAEADPKLLRVALENLFGNAVKFSSKKPESEISFGFDPEQNAWFVRDNGAGFDMHYRDKLFGAFNRLHGDKDFKGSGIGLATVARVVRRHHGSIWADSTLNQGATFWFTLG